MPSPGTRPRPRQLGDQLGQANALNDLGRAQQMAGDYPAAAQAQEETLGIYRDLGSRLGEAHALSDLGNAVYFMGDYPAAVLAQEEALGLYRDLGDRLGEADALTFLGVVLRMTGDHPASVRAFASGIRTLTVIRPGRPMKSAPALRMQSFREYRDTPPPPKVEITMPEAKGLPVEDIVKLFDSPVKGNPAASVHA